MELSSKWDTLTRNEQSYIASVSAGARQRSRFIALVSDYQRNVELMQLAEDSAGASTAQFNTQLTGLEASINRLTAAWEGLYTSVNASGFFSGAIDMATSFLKILDGVGLVGTAMGAAVVFAFSKIAIASTASSISIIKDEMKKTVAAKMTTNAWKNQIVTLKLAAAAMAPQLLVFGEIVAVIGAVTLVLSLLNKVINGHEIAIEKATEALQKYEGSIASLGQETKSLQNLQKEYNDLANAGQDTATVRQQLIDQFPELENRINIEIASQRELNEAIEEEIRLRKIQAAEDSAKAGKEREKLFYLNNPDYYEASTYEGSIKNYQLDIKGLQKQQALFIEERNNLNKQLLTLPQNDLEGRSVFENQISAQETRIEEINKKIKEFEKLIEEEQTNLNEINEKSFYTQSEISNIVAKNIDAFNIHGEYAQKILEGVFKNLKPDQITEEGIFTEEISKLAIDMVDTLNKKFTAIFSGSDNNLQTGLTNFLAGNFSEVSEEMISQFKNLGFDTAFEQLFTNYEKAAEKAKELVGRSIGSIWTDENFETQTNEKMQNWINEQGNDFAFFWIKKLDSIANDKKLVEKYSNLFYVAEKEGLTQDSPELEQLSKIDFTNMDNLIDNFKKFPEDATGFSEVLKTQVIQSIIDLGLVAENTQSRMSDFYSSIESLKKALESGLSFEEVMDLMGELGDEFSVEDFNIDPLTGKWKLREEAVKRYGEALIQNSLIEIKQGKIIAEQAEEEAKAKLTKDNYILALLEQSEQTKMLEITQAQLMNQSPELIAAMEAELGEIRKNAEETREQVKLDRRILKERKDDVKFHETQIAVMEDAIATGSYLNDLLGQTTKATNAATDASKAYAQTLKDQADALKEAADAEKNRIDIQIDAIKKVLEARKKALEDENKSLEDQAEKERGQQEILLQAYLKYLAQRKTAYQDQLDDLEKAAKAAQEAADDNNEKLNDQNKIAQDYYKDQAALIQGRIDALNKEAEAEDRLQKLQEARDAYEKAKNARTRLVLVRGAGWVFKRDQKELQSTYDALQEAQKASEIAKLNEEKDALEKQAAAWAEKAENIGKTTEELKKYADAYAAFGDLTEEERKNAFNIFAQAVLDNNALNQEAKNKQDLFDNQSDETKEGTLAWNIAQVDKLSDKVDDLLEKISKSAEELIKDSKIDQVVLSLDKLLGAQGIEGLTEHLNVLTNGVNAYVDNFLRMSEKISQNETLIEDIDKALDDWDELAKDLSKSQSELNEELRLFNQYNAMTTEQLMKNNELFRQMTQEVGALAVMWDRVNEAQQAYEFASKNSSTISTSSSGTSLTRSSTIPITGSQNDGGPTSLSTKGIYVYSGWHNPFNTGGSHGYWIGNKNVGAKDDHSTNFNNSTITIKSDAKNIDDLIYDLKRKTIIKQY